MSHDFAVSDSSNHSALLRSVLDQLACPECLGNLRFEGAGLVCVGCQRVFSIIDGIPLLISDRSEQGRIGTPVSREQPEVYPARKL